MKKSIYFAVLAVCCAFLLVSCEQNVRPTTRIIVRACQLQLHITVRQGAHAKQSFAGTVDFNDSSSFSKRTLKGETSSNPISLSFDGQAAHFILETDQGRVFGTGMMESDPSSCTGTGGGTQSGPAEGDLGDWRGEWLLTMSEMPAQEPQSSSNFPFWNIITSILPFVLPILLILAVVWIGRLWLSRTPKNLPPSKKAGSIKKSDQRNGAGALVEYSTTYTQDDLLFDLSFPIENASGYLGEYGINIAKAFGVKSDQVIAFEVWLFDKNGSQSASSILMSEFAYTNAGLKNELAKKGQVFQINAGEIIEVETETLRVQANILEVEYDTSQPNPRTIFKKVDIKLGVWSKAD